MPSDGDAVGVDLPGNEDDLPFWQWYGTRFVWNTIGDDYCPFCQGEEIAGILVSIHLAVGIGIGYVAFAITHASVRILLAALPVITLFLIGWKAAHGFLEHLYGWREETHEAVESVADEEDMDIVYIGDDDV